MSDNDTRAFDPLGHIRIAVSNLQESQNFYNILFDELKFIKVDEEGWASPEGLGVWIIQAAHPEHRYIFEAPGLHHVCFKVESKKMVDDLCNFLVVNSIHVIAPPKSYPQYTPDYYAVFFLDPDGIELEVAYY